MISTELDQLTGHMEWADALVWGVVLALPAASDDGRVRWLLHHLHTVQWVYLQLLRGEEMDAPEPERFPELRSLCRWARAYHVDLPGFLASLEEGELGRHVEFPWADRLVERYGPVHSTDLRQALLQVTSHSTYHRGQLATRIRELGGEPPLTDFVAWVWAGRPRAAWPETGE